jgi:hypothetical protein
LLSRAWLALLPISLWLFSGCTWTVPTESSSWLKRFNNQTISPHHALIEVALLERPWGDEYINQDIWKHTDGLLVDTLEQHGLLERNGIRMGQLVGVPPYDFQQLLLSRECCSNPEARIFPSGKLIPIFLSPTYDRTYYEVLLDQRDSDFRHDRARFSVDVTASFARGGRTKLTFTPRVEIDEAALPFHAAPDQSTWELKFQKVSKSYPELSWDVTIGTNQYLLIGTRMDRPGTIGQAAFSEQRGNIAIQRLLVIRNCRSILAQDASDPTEESAEAARVLPLAIQATMPAVRTKTP